MVRNFILFVIAYVVVVVFTPFVFIYKFVKAKDKSKYTKTCALGYDQAGGSVLYSQENFTISSYTYYLYRKNNTFMFMELIDFLFEKNHCERSYKDEIKHDNLELDEFEKELK
ncbi:MAG: hypothetical protein GXP61_08005 [Epsilonproteobacteria bacterium]|nr:hypothetical protein [Campylobacterota bacterium]